MLTHQSLHCSHTQCMDLDEDTEVTLLDTTGYLLLFAHISCAGPLFIFLETKHPVKSSLNVLKKLILVAF